MQQKQPGSFVDPDPILELLLELLLELELLGSTLLDELDELEELEELLLA